MWECPECHRKFKNSYQAHTCDLVDKELFFNRRPPHFRTIFADIERFVNSLGPNRQEAVRPDVVFFKTKSTFLAVKIKKAWMDVEFFLDHLEDVPPVKKYLQTSKNRVAHIVSIDEASELDSQLQKWIRDSYELISGNT